MTRLLSTEDDSTLRTVSLWDTWTHHTLDNGWIYSVLTFYVICRTWERCAIEQMYNVCTSVSCCSFFHFSNYKITVVLKPGSSFRSRICLHLITICTALLQHYCIILLQNFLALYYCNIFLHYITAILLHYCITTNQWLHWSFHMFCCTRTNQMWRLCVTSGIAGLIC